MPPRWWASNSIQRTRESCFQSNGRVDSSGPHAYLKRFCGDIVMEKFGKLPTSTADPLTKAPFYTASQVMNTSANNPNPLATTLAAALILSVVGLLIIAPRLSSSSAAVQERSFENKIPAHIPIKIKI